ncbi:MAG: MCE family protein [Actinomycetota bacterium]
MKPLIGLIASVLLALPGCAVLGFETACDGTEVIGNFEQVGDLVENANVQASDVVVGTVKQIELDGWEARVEMCLAPDQKIPEDVKAVVRTTSLLGEKFIDLQPVREGAPYLEDGSVITSDDTSKSTELEDVFAKLASVVGSGNLEQINRFTSAQANILRDHADDLRLVFKRLHRFTGTLADRKAQIAGSVDSLDAVARTILADSSILEDFLESFAESSGVLADESANLQELLFALDRFSDVSVRLLDQTTSDLDRQFRDLRPVLRTLAANSEDLAESLRTLATFAEWFPETMPGDYLQLDVCIALPESFGQGVTCPQAIGNDDPNRSFSSPSTHDGTPDALRLLLRRSLREQR